MSEETRSAVVVDLAELAAMSAHAWMDHVPRCPTCAVPMNLMEFRVGSEAGFVRDAVDASYYCPGCRAGIVLGRDVAPLVVVQ